MGKAHMVRQIIQYSDGSETVINYRGVIENGVLTEDSQVKETKAPKTSKKETLVSKAKNAVRKIIKK